MGKQAHTFLQNNTTPHTAKLSWEILTKSNFQFLYLDKIGKRLQPKRGEAAQMVANHQLAVVVMHLIGLNRNNLLWVAFLWPNTKFESLLFQY